MHATTEDRSFWRRSTVIQLVSVGALLWISSGCASVTASSPASDATHAVPARVNRVAEEYLRAWLQEFPDKALLNGYTPQIHDHFADNSLAARQRWTRREDAWLAELAGINHAALWGQPEWITYGNLKEALESARDLRVCRQELWKVDQMSGWQVSFSRLAQLQPVGTAELRAQAFRRWRSLPQWVDTEITNLRQGMRLGYTSPKPNVKRVVDQLETILAADDRSPFLSPAERDSSAGFSDVWKKMHAQEIIPAIRKYRDFLVTEYAKAARDAAGVAANPNGAACWRASFRSYTSLERSPEETYRLGTQMVAKYTAETREAARNRFATTNLDSLRKAILQDPKRKFEGRDELLAYARDEVERARAESHQWFLRMPKAQVIIEPHPSYTEQSGSNQYFQAAIDGSRPAVFRMNLSQARETLRPMAEITAVHETYPGHHLQLALAAEVPGVHAVNLIVGNAAFVEGWARYSETLAEEMGFYQEPYSLIERRRIPGHGTITNPGIHLMGWTREQAVSYILACCSPNRARAESWVDRQAILLAQQTSYDTGGLEFFTLRERAKKELGDKFDIREFHDVVLRYGIITLPMLREVVDRWIKEKQLQNSSSRR